MVPRDAGLGTHPSTRRDGALEDLGDFAARALLFYGELERATQLAEYLELSGHHRAKAGRDLKEVCGDIVFEVDRQAIVELALRQLCRLGEGFGDLFDGPVEAVDDGDNFGAKTGGEKDGFVDVAVAHQGAQHLRPLVFGDGRAL